MRNGLDFADGNGLTIEEILKGDFSFVGRYLSGGGSKDIVKTELDNYLAAKIGVIFFWETDGIMSSYADGKAAALAADKELEEIGASGAPVFFTADAETMPDMTGYMQGAEYVVGHNRMGIYGGFGTVQAAFSQKLTKYAVQTYAWSGSPTQWDTQALVRQYRNDVPFGPATVDLEQAAFWGSSKILTMDDDFGQFPRPVTKPSGPQRHTIQKGEDISPYALAEKHNMKEDAWKALQASFVTNGDLSELHFEVLSTMIEAGNANASASLERPNLEAGTVYYTTE